jgi:hypothetical protein
MELNKREYVETIRDGPHTYHVFRTYKVVYNPFLDMNMVEGVLDYEYEYPYQFDIPKEYTTIVVKNDSLVERILSIFNYNKGEQK